MKVLLLFFCLFFSIVSFAQVDSLQKVLYETADDSNKVNILIRLSESLRPVSIDSALLYGNQAKTLAEKINYPKGSGYALKAIGLVYNLNGDYVNAMQAWKEALDIFEKHDIKVGIANMTNNIGVIYFNKGDESNALDYYLRSLKESEEIKDTLRIATALTNLGGIYSNKPATYDKALSFHKQALMYGSAIADTELIGNSNANIGEMFISYYKLDSSRSNQLDSALFYLMRARENYNTSENLPYAFNNIGKVYRLKKDFIAAVKYYRLGFESAQLLNDKLDMGQALLGIAETKKDQLDFIAAIKGYKEAEIVLKEIGLEETYDLLSVYEGLTFCYASINDFANAFKYQSQVINVKNKIYNYEVEKKLGTKLFAYEIEKKQGEINLQTEVIARQKLIRNGFIGGFTIVLLFATVFFAQRNKIKKGKKRSDELLLNILPAETAEELKATGTAKAKHFELVTVLFTDFKNFTQASEKLSPEELVNEINHCYSEFDKIITRLGIEKIKTIGDSYLCAGGLPAINTTNPVDVVAAGLEMVNFIEKNKQERIAQGQPYFELRCGIHSGPVVAGIVGIKKFAYDIWGDTVNTASRMESSGETGKVNISGTTYELVKHRYNCLHRGKIEAKGKGEIDMYFVIDRAFPETIRKGSAEHFHDHNFSRQ